MDRRSFAIQNVIISFATVTILLNSIQANLWFFKVAHVIYICEASEGQKASVLLLSKPCRMFQSALYTACSSYLTFPMSQWLKMLKVCTTWLVERPRWTERNAPVNHKHILRSIWAKGFPSPFQWSSGDHRGCIKVAFINGLLCMQPKRTGNPVWPDLFRNQCYTKERKYH